jgi:hypothetical protein
VFQNIATKFLIDIGDIDFLLSRINWQERCRQLESRIRSLEAELKEAANAKEKTSKMQGALERTKERRVTDEVV